MRTQSLLCAGLSVVAVASMLGAQESRSSTGDAIAVHSSGLEGLLVDPKDKGLLTALRLVDERILELPAETGQRDMPAGALRLAWDLLTSPLALRAGMLPNADPHAGPPFYAQLDVLTADGRQAQSLSDRFVEVFTALAHQPLKSAPSMPGMKMIDADGAPIFVGPRSAGQQNAFTIGLNRVDPSMPSMGKTDLPKDARPAMVVEINPQQMRPFFDMIFARGGPQQEPLRQQLQLMGLYGPNAGSIHVASGYSGSRGYTTVRREKYRQMMEKTGMLASSGLAVADFRRIPADATAAQISKFNLRSLGTMITGLVTQASMRSGEPPPDVMAEIEKQTGINPQRDIFDHLGETSGVYTSDTTGGGGLMSAVVFVEIKNTDAFEKSLDRLTGTVNRIGQRQAKGYVRFDHRKINDHPVTVLCFPGLPIPLEISMGLSDGFLYAAISPQALLAAMKQGQGGSAGLMDNAAFKQAGGDKAVDAMTISFLDTPRTMRDGYGLISLVMAALANAVRSPSDPARDPGVVMPSIGELMKDANASLTITLLDKDDLLTTAQHDRSVLVNACGVAGMAGTSVSGVGASAIMAGLLLPALAKARQQAQALKSTTQLRMIAMAMTTYAADHHGQLPPDLKTMVDEQFFNNDILKSPLGPAPDGRGDYWINLGLKKFDDVKDPDTTILGYDRAMYAGEKKVAVVFCDGHAEVLDPASFESMLKRPPNAGTDFHLPEAK